MSEDAKWLIMEDYAKILCVTPKAVRAAIDSGRIPSYAVSTTNFGGRTGKKARILIDRTIADVAWVNTENVTQGRRTPEAKAAVKRLKEELNINETETKQSLNKENNFNDMTHAEAQRREKIAKAEIARIELLQLKGSLLKKDAVYMQLFEAGQMLRDTIMAVPERITDEIVSVNGNRTQIRKIITEALASSLEGMTDLYTKKLG
jgi:hypothetical protein